MSGRLLDPATRPSDGPPEDSWWLLEDCEQRVPRPLRSWLAEPGLLTARVRAVCGQGARLRLLRLAPAPLEPELSLRMGIGDRGCLLRDVEIGCRAARWVFARSVFPDSTVSRHPWLRELGDTGLGEYLARVGEIRRETLEYRELRPGDALFMAAAEGAGLAGPIWARRAVYRLVDAPILVQEVFLPALESAAGQ
ncbi:MAG TPA: chorismate lyase [Steroidobacteraceae bacterium]|nr:chorismate lyase [Steroidobacteraceae bacterium]